jgi:hypothetical protein
MVLLECVIVYIHRPVADILIGCDDKKKINAAGIATQT